MRTKGQTLALRRLVQEGVVDCRSGRRPVTVLRVDFCVRWEKDDWTGTASNWVKVPYDGVTAPSYVTQATYEAFDWTAMPADNGSDDRANAAYLDLRECDGPVFDVVS